jgi:hypothetical protein
VLSVRPRFQYRVGVDARFLFVWTEILPKRIGEHISYMLATTKGMRTVRGLVPDKVAASQ